MIRLRKGAQRNGARRDGWKAQGLVEFALILPILLVTLFVLIELARVLHAWMAVENGARFGVRLAVTGEFDPSLCPGGVCVDDTAEKNARLKSIYGAAEAGSASVLRDFAVTDVTQNGFFKVTVCDPDYLIDPATPTEQFECSGGEYPGDPGQQVSVVVEFTHPLITPFVSSIVPNLHISSQRDATVETFRVVQAGSGAPGADPPPPGPPEEPPPPPPPPDPCENIILSNLRLSNRSAVYHDRMWKLAFSLYNNNSFDGTISWFELDWTRHDDLDFTRWVYRYLGKSGSAYRVNLPGQQSGPITRAFMPFPSRPQEGMPSMYGEICVNMYSSYCRDDDDYLKNATTIPAGDYTFTVTLIFDFGEYGTCSPDPLSITGRAPAKSGGSGGGGGDDDFIPPDIPPGDGDPPPGGGGGPSD